MTFSMLMWSFFLFFSFSATNLVGYDHVWDEFFSPCWRHIGKHWPAKVQTDHCRGLYLKKKKSRSLKACFLSAQWRIIQKNYHLPLKPRTLPITCQLLRKSHQEDRHPWSGSNPLSYGSSTLNSLRWKNQTDHSPSCTHPATASASAEP